MSVRKIITITNDENEESYQDIITKVKFYKLSKVITIDPQAESLPEFYKDIDANIDFCGLDEIAPAKVSQISETLFNAQKEFLAAYGEFERKVFEIEGKANQSLVGVASEYAAHEKCSHPQQIFEPISVKFSNQDGEANIAMRLSFASGGKQENKYPTNPVAETITPLQDDGSDPIYDRAD